MELSYLEISRREDSQVQTLDNWKQRDNEANTNHGCRAVLVWYRLSIIYKINTSSEPEEQMTSLLINS
jgi:hypothetical protein